MSSLSDYIRDIPDFPKKGIIFKDITPLLKSHQAFSTVMNTLYELYKNKKIDYVAGIESRGFIIGSALANKLGAGFVPIRKKGKLPYKTISLTYDLEYGSDTIEIHEDAFAPGDRVLLVDDLIATGGTLKAAAELIGKLDANLIDIAVVVELCFLKGRETLGSYPLYSLLTY
ncbi:MAG: adenine phosphoribosyltransferase [Candidatus Auribacterota bacterium]|jgi:adenine phosphoribosyltransferase|uniref:Adenine phosphoribosyltransferase n=1 Tax=Candidatus Auribacter fodinae TaxID=2093366 RepID=A0A3A4R188_9BACT|nr:MAG: adenine phosphoribosyltransferase [Candidatus Auribacter fodinae]